MIGADRSCQVCTRLVCESCAADWTTCPEPTGREVRLGRTARLRDVDPTGRIGLVTRWFGVMKLFDVRRLRWVDVELPRQRTVHDREILERVSPTGDLYFNQYTFLPLASDVTTERDRAADIERFASLRRQSLVTGESSDIDTEEPMKTAAMTPDGHYYYVSSTQLVVVVAPDGSVRRFEPMPRRVIQACHLDVEASVLASATWGEIVLHRIVGDRLMPLSRIAVEGNVSWIALDEPYLVACVGEVVRVWRIGENLAIGRELHQHLVGMNWRTGSLSRDGRYLAIGVDRSVIVHDLDQDVSVTFDDHSDDICLVRFVGSDHLLVTADQDNRVVMRPRAPAGYVRSLIDIDVPDDPIKLDLEEDLVPR